MGDATRPTLSIVVLTFNSGAVIGDTLRSISRFLPEAEILLVDNDSSDDTVVSAREAAPDLRLVTGHGNVGFGAGVNLGVAAAHGEVVLVLNPDAPLVDASLPRLGAMNGPDTPFGLVACAVIDGPGRSHLVFRQRGWLRELTTFLAWAFLKPREFRYTRPYVSPSDRGAWVCGAAFMISRNEFLDLGGFDADYFLYCEDCDLSRRYRARGLPLATTDAICVAHSSEGEKASQPVERVGWTLLSMVEYAAKWDGPRSGRAAAAYVSWFLRILIAIEPLSPCLPAIGRRAMKSSKRAALVREHIAQACRGRVGPREAYPFARRAFAGL